MPLAMFKEIFLSNQYVFHHCRDKKQIILYKCSVSITIRHAPEHKLLGEFVKLCVLRHFF